MNDVAKFLYLKHLLHTRFSPSLSEEKIFISISRIKRWQMTWVSAHTSSSVDVTSSHRNKIIQLVAKIQNEKLQTLLFLLRLCTRLYIYTLAMCLQCVCTPKSQPIRIAECTFIYAARDRVCAKETWYNLNYHIYFYMPSLCMPSSNLI